MNVFVAFSDEVARIPKPITSASPVGSTLLLWKMRSVLYVFNCEDCQMICTVISFLIGKEMLRLKYCLNGSSKVLFFDGGLWFPSVFNITEQIYTMIRRNKGKEKLKGEEGNKLRMPIYLERLLS